MAVNTFGVTASTVAALHFPMIPGFSALGKPTAATVAIMIDQSAAVLEGRLYKENITAADITTTSSAPYLMCAEQLGRMVALKALKAMTQKFPELAKELTAEVDAWFASLDAGGATFLGNSSLASTPANGPTSHVSVNSLTMLAGEDMSDVIPPLQKKQRM